MSDLSFLNQIPDPLRGVADVPPVVAAPRRPAVSPTRSQTQGRRVAAFGISLAWLAAHLAVYGVRGDFERLSSAYVAAQVGVPIVFAAASLFVALAPGKFGLGVGVSIAAGAAVLGPLSFWLVAAGLQPPYPAPSSSAFWLGSLVCLDITLAWA
ncbi:MAG TPA: hypothetical protein VJU61_03750, partial [Polyangiaceae bacterium]|nr:hypothetical protein [Polyangiaceae bacterium]